MKDKQLKAIDARINYVAKIFDLEPFVVKRPSRFNVRKIMTRFLQGIGATLLTIVIGYLGIVAVQYMIAQTQLHETHFEAYTGCANCNKRGWHYFEKGTIILSNNFNCNNCGIRGKMSGTNTLIPIRQEDG